MQKAARFTGGFILLGPWAFPAPSGVMSATKIYTRVLKNKHQVVRQGARDFEKRSISGICEHFRRAGNAE
jgi:hypothetical protein